MQMTDKMGVWPETATLASRTISPMESSSLAVGSAASYDFSARAAFYVILLLCHSWEIYEMAITFFGYNGKIQLVP